MEMAQSEQKADRYRWVILGVLWVSYLVVFLNRLSIGPLAPFLKDDLGINSTHVGLVMSAASFGYMFTMFPVGWAVDKIGARWPIVMGEMIAGVCMIALFFTTSHLYLLVFMFVTGMGCGFLFPSTTQGVVVWFPPRERATVMGLKQTAVNIGGMITAATLPAVALDLGWHYGFLFIGLLAIVIGVLSFIFYKEPSPSSCSASSPAVDETPMSVREILKNREIWLLAFCGFCLTWVEMTLVAHLVLYFTEVLLFSVITAGGLAAMTELAGAIARPGSGLLSDRAFNGNRKQVFMLMAGITCITCLIIGFFAPQLAWPLYPVLFFLGMGSKGFGGIHLTLASEMGGPRGAGKAVGFVGIITLAGGVVGPPLFGLIVDSSHSYTLAMLSLALLSAVSLLLLVFVREEHRKI